MLTAMFFFWGDQQRVLYFSYVKGIFLTEFTTSKMSFLMITA